MATIREQGINYLEPIIEEIQNQEIRNFVEKALFNYVPQDFFFIPASSSGRHHPSYSLGIGGLVRHTKAAGVIALGLFPIYNFTALKQDLALAAILLHDTEKPDKDHPILVKHRLEELRGFKYYTEIIDLIECHMGQWNNFGKFPKPKGKLQKFVHLCDYLASRKEIKVDV